MTGRNMSPLAPQWNIFIYLCVRLYFVYSLIYMRNGMDPLKVTRSKYLHCCTGNSLYTTVQDLFYILQKCGHSFCNSKWCLIPANHNRCAAQALGLRPLPCWDCENKSYQRHILSLFMMNVLCCRVKASAKSWLLVQMRSTEFGVTECDLET
jgi:hypothetical protein